ncbi:MAG: hypothetical protein AAB320_04820 [Elusimicrobiota bacterium]
MIKTALLAALLTPGFCLAAGAGPESLRAAGDALFLQSPALFAPAPVAAPQEPILQNPKIAPIGKSEAPGRQVAVVALPGLLDGHRDLMARQLGAVARLVSVAGDAAFKNYFLTFAWAGQLVIAPLGDLNRLRGDGIDVRIDPATAYNFKVKVNIFSPTRGSSLEMTPVQGTRGPAHSTKTGVILDAVKANSHVFSAKGKEYWLLFGTDVDAATNTLGKTRSLLIIHEAGLSSKAWPLAETALPEDRAVVVSLGDAKLFMQRSQSGVLTINEVK